MTIRNLFRKNTETLMKLFADDCEFERIKQLPKRQKFEAQMTREENLVKENEKRGRSKLPKSDNQRRIEAERDQLYGNIPFVDASHQQYDHDKNEQRRKQERHQKQRGLVEPPKPQKSMNELKPLTEAKVKREAAKLTDFGSSLAQVRNFILDENKTRIASISKSRADIM